MSDLLKMCDFIKSTLFPDAYLIIFLIIASQIYVLPGKFGILQINVKLTSSLEKPAISKALAIPAS